MANPYYDFWASVTAPLVSFFYWLRDQVSFFVDLVVAIWPDNRPLHTLGYEAAHPRVAVAQRARSMSFSRRRLERLPAGRSAFLTPRWAM